MVWRWINGLFLSLNLTLALVLLFFVLGVNGFVTRKIVGKIPFVGENQWPVDQIKFHDDIAKNTYLYFYNRLLVGDNSYKIFPVFWNFEINGWNPDPLSANDVTKDGYLPAWYFSVPNSSSPYNRVLFTNSYRYKNGVDSVLTKNGTVKLIGVRNEVVDYVVDVKKLGGFIELERDVQSLGKDQLMVVEIRNPDMTRFENEYYYLNVLNVRSK